MPPRSWMTAGWVSIAITAGLAIAAIVQVLGAASPACIQPLAANGAVPFTCQGAVAEFVRGLICAVLAGVAFFSGLACFFWAAHLRCMQQMARIRQSQDGAGTRFSAETGASRLLARWCQHDASAIRKVR